ncbi:hypothetical protein HanRHA438_Chr08g0371821 [Helianthus annuus]|uniref:Uncharacterized protein n=1 Tax=Helianthus annuus TaxID=4232 RepID=A0A251U8R5_HELAN|nr:hypothetical protein HanXRQr2_Chr08g0359761 [Helianthus annuus]KAJ0899717.1 hypothetical protein HanRHA438_Chr08g0371821 [Helianthus annuus]KAJ0903276.1 hypothetical protein HanPSC8_Chr08g0347231 [Helianthus annuus]
MAFYSDEFFRPLRVRRRYFISGSVNSRQQGVQVKQSQTSQHVRLTGQRRSTGRVSIFGSTTG